MTHELKILPEYFGAVEQGQKTAELRFNDRGFAVGDELLLREHRRPCGVCGSNGGLTGRVISVTVTHVVRSEPMNGLRDQWVMLSFKVNATTTYRPKA